MLRSTEPLTLQPWYEQDQKNPVGLSDGLNYEVKDKVEKTADDW